MRSLPSRKIYRPLALGVAAAWLALGAMSAVAATWRLPLEAHARFTARALGALYRVVSPVPAEELSRPADDVADLPLQGELPEACRSGNPFFASSCFVRGATFDGDPAVVAFNDSPDNTGHFNDEAWVQTGLTRDRDLVLAELPRMLDRVQEGTRLDLALVTGQEVLESNQRLLQNLPVLVLLTDGIPNRVPTPVPGGSQEDTVLAMAARAKEAGTVVFTIGLGKPEDIVAWMLEAASSDRSRYYYAPDGEDLTAIYTQIAGRVRECVELPD